MSDDEKKSLKDIQDIILELESDLTFEIVGKEISAISKLPFKVIALVHALHHRAMDLAKSSYEQYEQKSFLSSAILIRSLMETVALVFLLYKKLHQVNEEKKIGEIDEFLMNSTFGGRTEDSTLTSPNILTAMDHTNKKYDKFRQMYDSLSEFVHPNWFGTSGLYSKLDDDEIGAMKGKVSFGKNVNSEAPKFILAPYFTALVVLRITFSDLAKNFDEFIKIAEDDIKNQNHT